jgi:dihydrofolate reductase
MGKLTYSAITSLDGFIEDPDGEIRWGAPDDEVAAFVNDQERSARTYLYGRRMYETMLFWETAASIPDTSPPFREFTDHWLAADKVVFSRSLASVSSGRTRLERELNTAAIQSLKDADEGDLSVGGADLAAQLFGAGLVDECKLYLTPVALGGGKRALPAVQRLELELLDDRRFASGVVFVHYRVQPGAATP